MNNFLLRLRHMQLTFTDQWLAGITLLSFLNPSSYLNIKPYDVIRLITLHKINLTLQKQYHNCKMANVIPIDRNNPADLLRSCINSINKSIMFHSVDIIVQSGHLRRLHKTYDKVFDFVHRIINGNVIAVPENTPGGWDTDDWLALSLAQATTSFCFTNNLQDPDEIDNFINNLYDEARSWVCSQSTWYPDEDIGY